jgi:hypothetical protein
LRQHGSQFIGRFFRANDSDSDPPESVIEPRAGAGTGHYVSGQTSISPEELTDDDLFATADHLD